MSDDSRTFRVVPPEQRPHRRRSAVRLVVLSSTEPDAEAVLLFEDSDPGIADVRWWVTPGGGMDPGETEAQTGVRELHEETGLRVAESELIGPLARRVVLHGYSDQVLEQVETFYAVRTPRFDVDASGHTPQEQITLQSSRWWGVDELAGTDAWIWPQNLRDLVAVTRDPRRWPLELGTVVDESTVPVSLGSRS